MSFLCSIQMNIYIPDLTGEMASDLHKLVGGQKEHKYLPGESLIGLENEPVMSVKLKLLDLETKEETVYVESSDEKCGNYISIQEGS